MNLRTLLLSVLASLALLAGVYLFRAGGSVPVQPAQVRLPVAPVPLAAPVTSAPPPVATVTPTAPVTDASEAAPAPALEVPPAPPPVPTPVAVLPREESRPAAGLCEDDRLFFERAVQSCVKQDKVSRGVLNQLVYPEVREYAYLIVTDQTAATAELLAMATRKGVTIPAPERISFRQWGREEQSIDQHYIHLLTEDNEAVLEVFERAERSADEEIAGFARRTLPLIQRHLSAARALKKVTD